MKDTEYPHEWDETKLIPGKLYMKLFHGRSSPDEQLNDWGLDGPFLGPVEFFHVTYFSNFVIDFESHDVFEVNDHMKEDFLVFDGIYYGDYSLFIHEEKDK